MKLLLITLITLSTNAYYCKQYESQVFGEIEVVKQFGNLCLAEVTINEANQHIMCPLSISSIEKSVVEFATENGSCEHLENTSFSGVIVQEESGKTYLD